MRPGPSSRYGSRPRRRWKTAAIAPPGPPGLCADRALECGVDLRLVGGRERLEVVRVGEVRENERALAHGRVRLQENLPRALDGGHVLDVVRDLGGDVRLVVEVHQLLRR